MIKKVILAFKTHFDIGFTDTAANVIAAYKGKMLSEVLEICNDTKDMGQNKYIWTMPSWPLYEMLEIDSNNRSENALAAEQLVKRGQLYWHSLPFTSHFDFCGLEDYIRGFRYTKELSEKFGMEIPVSAKMTDVPGHGIMLPSILNMMGIKFLHIGTNEFATPPDVPLIFNWESPDGNKVMTMFSKAAYGTPLKAPDDWEFPTWLAILQTHDNIGPQTKESLQKIIKKAKKLYPDAEIVTGTMDDFYKEMEQYKDKLPTMKKDLADTWIHGVGTYPNEVKNARKTRRILTKIEKAMNIAKIENEEIYENIKKAYFQLMMFGEHTWGLDVKAHMGTYRAYDEEDFEEFKNGEIGKLMEFSWNEQKERAEAGLELAHACQKELISAFPADEKTLTIFNPSGNLFSGYVSINNLKDKLADKAIKCGDEVYYPEHMPDGLMVYVKNLEPLTFTEFEVLDGDLSGCAEKKESYIENHKYKISFNAETGVLTEILDKENDRNIINTDSDESFLGYRYDRYSFRDINEFLRVYGYKFWDWGISDYGKREYPVCERIVQRPKLVSCKVTDCSITFVHSNEKDEEAFGNAKTIKTEIKLPKYTDDIFIRVSIENKQESLYAEAGYITMPFKLQKSEILINKTGCMIDIATDIVKDANHVNYCIENSVAISDDDYAVTVYSEDIPLLSVGETGMYYFRNNYEEHEPTLFFNAFNNMWGTNFPQWIGGDFSYNFTIKGHKKSDVPKEYENVIAKAENCTCFMGKAAAGLKLPKLPCYLYPTSFQKLDNGYLLRVRDTSGAENEAEISLEDGNTSACIKNLRKDVIAKSAEGVLKWQSKPYGIYNIYLEK